MSVVIQVKLVVFLPTYGIEQAPGLARRFLNNHTYRTVNLPLDLLTQHHNFTVRIAVQTHS